MDDDIYHSNGRHYAPEKDNGVMSNPVMLPPVG